MGLFGSLMRVSEQQSNQGNRAKLIPAPTAKDEDAPFRPIYQVDSKFRS